VLSARRAGIIRESLLLRLGKSGGEALVVPVDIMEENP